MGDIRKSAMESMSPDDQEFVYSFRLKLLKYKTNEVDSDVLLISKDQVRVKAHKIILRTCDFFDRLFNSRQRELEYHIDIDFDNLDAILKYIYAGIVDVTSKNFYSIFESSRQLELDLLTKKVFIDRPKDVINMENWLELFRYANGVRDDDFLDELDLFIKNSLTTFVKCPNFFALKFAELKMLMIPPSRLFYKREDYHMAILTWWNAFQSTAKDKDLSISIDTWTIAIVELLNVEWGFEGDSDDDSRNGTINSSPNVDEKIKANDAIKDQQKKEFDTVTAHIEAQSPRINLIRVKETNELVSAPKLNKRKDSPMATTTSGTSSLIECFGTTKRQKLNTSDDYLDEVERFKEAASGANAYDRAEIEKLQLEYEKIRFRAFKDGGFKGRPYIKFFSKFGTYDAFQVKNSESQKRNFEYSKYHTNPKCYMCGSVYDRIKQTIDYNTWLFQHYEASHKL